MSDCTQIQNESIPALNFAGRKRIDLNPGAPAGVVGFLWSKRTSRTH
jgi:hypothetical protein